MDRKRNRQEKVTLDKIIGGNIRTERELRGITRDELAEFIDLTVSHLGLIERGERGATPVTILRLVRAFDISIDSLFVERGKGLIAKETKSASSAGIKKVSTLMTYLNDTELEFVAHTIKGMGKMRDTGSLARQEKSN